MMHTEEQARKLWCPWVRIHLALAENGDVVDSPVAFNRQISVIDGKSKDLPAGGCIVSGCAAWRWADETNPRPEDKAQWGGFCGLAGKPEPCP